MKTAHQWILGSAIMVLLLSGCTPALVGGAAVGAGTGTFVYLKGELKTDYNQAFDSVWKACEKTVADMRGVDVIPAKEIGKGKISALIDGEKVEISVSYKAKNVTTVSVRVGLIGNNESAQLIHDKIGDNLTSE
jgi:hypothetical protein